MRFRTDEGGQTLVMLAVSLSTLMGFMALAVDVGLLFHVRREVQIAADAAAMAGALDYHYNPSGTTARAAALAAASQNGVTDGSNGRTVNVTFPLGSTYRSPYGNGFVQAVVSVPNPTFFMKLFQMSSVDVGAGAVAGPGASQGCIWTLGFGANISGSGNLTASGCEIYDNSNSSNALDLTGSIAAKQVGVAAGGFSGSVSPMPITGMTPLRDPLTGLPTPGISTGSGCQPARNFRFGNHNLTPGCYNGISISGSATLALNAGNYVIDGNFADSSGGAMTLGTGNYTVTGTFSKSGNGALDLGSGEYIAEGGLQLGGSGRVTGTSVSFYSGGATTVSGSGIITLSAPTSGPENGILLFQAGGDTSPMAISGSNLNLQGIVYARDAQLGFGGSGSGNVYADFVVGSLNITGTSNLQNYALVNRATPLTKIVMVQ